MKESSMVGLRRIVLVILAAFQVFMVARSHTSLLHALSAASVVLLFGMALLPQSKTRAEEESE